MAVLHLFATMLITFVVVCRIILLLCSSNNLPDGVAHFFFAAAIAALPFVLHPPILEPDFNLSFREVERPGDLNASRSA